MEHLENPGMQIMGENHDIKESVLSPQLSAVPSLEQSVLTGSSSGSINGKNEKRPAEQDSVTNAPACTSGVAENKSVIYHLHDTEVSKLSSEAASASSSENKTSSKMSEELIDSKNGNFGDGYCEESGNIDNVESDNIFPSKPAKAVHLKNQQNDIVNVKLLEDEANVKNLTLANGSETSTYSCLENEKSSEISQGSVSLNAASVVNGYCSQGLQSNKKMDICENLTSVSEKQNVENQKSHSYSVNVMMDISKNEEHATETQVTTSTENVEQAFEGTTPSMEHKMTNPSCAQSTGTLPDSDTANDVYVMEKIDKVLDVLCEENPETKGNVEQGNSSSSEYSSDSDDESSSSESSTSSDSSSSEDLENIRKEIEKEEEKLQAGPPKTKSEVLIKELPEVPDLDINLENDTELVELGQVFSIVEMLVVVKAFPQTPALDSDSILFLENRSCLGLVFETFGPVQTPFYSVRFNKESDINDKGVCRGDKVFYAPDIMEYSHYVFVTQLKKLKGSDASWKNDEEPPQELIEYSDDEEEEKAKVSKRKERMAKSGSSENASSEKVDETGAPLQQGWEKSSRKRSWQNHAKAHPVDQKQNAVVIQRGPPPRPDSGPRFAPQAVGRPFMDHFTSGAQLFGIRPMAPPGGGPAGRFSRRGPPSGGPLYMVPPHTRQFQRRPPEGSSLQENYPVRQPSGFTLRHCLPPRQGFSGPLSGGPCFQGPWQVSAPSGFPSQHPMPQGFPEPCFQGQNYIGMHPRPPWPHNL